MVETNFGPDFFTANRLRLRALFTGTAPVVITAHGVLQRSGDTTFPFRQDSNFWYLTGINEPDVLLVIDKDREYLILPKRAPHQETFDGAIESAALTERSGIGMVLDQKIGWKQLAARLKRAKHVATLAAPPAYLNGHGFYTNPARSTLITRLKEVNPELELLDLRDHLTRLRMVKRPEELVAIKQAIAITTASIKTTMKRRTSFAYEYEVEAALSQGFRRRGTYHGYEPIVAGGQNACTLHYIANQSLLQSRDLLLIDVGAAVEHYSADITRTYALQPPTKRQLTVHAAVLEVQDFARGLLRPGVLMKEYEQQVAHFMGEKLRELGLIKSINEETIRQFYPHATSHFLGLDVHDVGDYLRPLEAGMVLTVEPGIYIPRERLGIRIEDDVLITAKGAQVLSKNLPRSLW